MKSSLLVFSTLVLAVLTPVSPAQDQTAPVFLVHSGPEFTSKTASALGAHVVRAEGPITPERLTTARILSIIGPTAPFTDNERNAIHEFVRRGGSLLVVVDDNRRQPQAREIANPLLAPFGMEFTADVPYIHNVGAVAEAGVLNRTKREIPYSGGRGVTGGTPFSIIQDTDHLAHAAFVELPSGGRIVAMGEGMVALGLGKPEGVRLSGVPNDPARTTYWGKDSAIFMEEVLTWLLAKR